MCTKTDLGIFLQTPCWLMNSGYNDVIVAAWKNQNSSPGNAWLKYKCIKDRSSFVDGRKTKLFV